MKIQMRGNKIGIQKLGKASKSKSFIELPEENNSIGVVKYVGENTPSDITIGLRVLYGDNRQRVTMDGADIEVMEEGNIFAILEDDLDEKDQTEERTL